MPLGIEKIESPVTIGKSLWLSKIVFCLELEKNTSLALSTNQKKVSGYNDSENDDDDDENDYDDELMTLENIPNFKYCHCHNHNHYIWHHHPSHHNLIIIIIIVI